MEGESRLLKRKIESFNTQKRGILATLWFQHNCAYAYTNIHLHSHLTSHSDLLVYFRLVFELTYHATRIKYDLSRLLFYILSGAFVLLTSSILVWNFESCMIMLYYCYYYIKCWWLLRRRGKSFRNSWPNVIKKFLKFFAIVPNFIFCTKIEQRV